MTTATLIVHHQAMHEDTTQCGRSLPDDARLEQRRTTRPSQTTCRRCLAAWGWSR